MNIIFFHRLDLVHLYAPVSKVLNNKHKIIHVAFSDNEEEILTNEYGIFENIYNLSKIRDFFFDNSSDISAIEELDSFILNNTGERFNLNTSIYLDRTYTNLSLDECYQISLSYYKSWKMIFNESKPNLFFHEPPAIFFSHLASIFCKFYGVRYLTQIHVVGGSLQWIFLEGDTARPLEIEINKKKYLTKEQSTKVEAFVDSFIKSQDILMSEFNIIPSQLKKRNVFLFIRQFSGLLYRHYNLRRIKNKKNHPSQHCLHFLKSNRKSFFIELENIHGRIFHDYFSYPNKNEKYFFYPLHLEPEAVVLYYADGWYEGQIKLIENIAMQLPVGVFLYVKDHPHGGAYRDVRDYKRLLKLKNIKLIQTSVSSKTLIKNSIGVITINGTAGFEALLMRKHVFCFGRSFYSDFKGVHYLNHVKDLKKAILGVSLEAENNFDYLDISSFLESSHKGFVSYFSGRQNKIGIDLNENAEEVANGIQKLITKL